MLPSLDPITRLPIVVIYPHSRCNCRCKMCDIWRATGRTEITLEEVEAWAGEWSRLGVRRVALSGGEALMHYHIEAFCAVLHSHGVGITLLTTGLLLERHAVWLPRYVDDVIVSLDGPEEVHNEIRQIPRAFEKLKAGVRALRDGARTLRDPGRSVRAPSRTSPAVSIGGRCVVQKSNFRHLRETVQAAKEIGLDRISFLAADVSSEAFNRPGGWSEERSSDVALDADDLPALEHEFELLELECAADFTSGFIAESVAKLRSRLLDHYRALSGQCDFPTVTCNAPWVSCVIESDGAVRPCFFQPAYGNIRHAATLEEVLNSPAAIAFRRGLDVRTDPICRRCVCTLALRENQQ